jgi:hypothetical protein
MTLPRPRSTNLLLSWPWLPRLFAALASLQLAVVLIGFYAAVLAWATMVESRYGTPAAHFGIYDSGWFAAIHVLLAVNVFCAALVRFPWKRRQTGFVVTHTGVLVLLAGCLLTQRGGIEAQLSLFEGRAAHRAYQESYHFELQVIPTGSTAAAQLAPVCVPFVSGPFSWDDYVKLPRFPWRLAHRSQGVVYDADGIQLEVIDYAKEPQPATRVRLTVDGTAKEFDVVASSDEPPEADLRHTVMGKRRRVALTLRPDEVDLGFQLYLHRFRRKLDPGTGMASHYSSLVDVLDRSHPPKKLREDVLITLNAPLDVADPQTGLVYRLFQSSFEGPWMPGEPEFDRLAGKDHGRDQVYLSRLSVNYDPGRGLKYVGCLLIVVGIVIVYYLRAYFVRKENNALPSTTQPA